MTKTGVRKVLRVNNALRQKNYEFLLTFHQTENAPWFTDLCKQCNWLDKSYTSLIVISFDALIMWNTIFLVAIKLSLGLLSGYGPATYSVKKWFSPKA